MSHGAQKIQKKRNGKKPLPIHDAVNIDIETSEGFLTAKDGLKLHWRSHRPISCERAPRDLALIHGYGEHLGRYQHVADDFIQRGFAVHLFEYRGHGSSGGKRAHVDRFSDYLDDLDVFLAHLLRNGARPLTLVAHSLGGLISARWLQTRDTTPIERAILCSPFFGLAFEPPVWKRRFSKIASRILPSLTVSNELSVDLLTTDLAMKEKTANDPLYLRITTPRWFSEVNIAQQALFEDAQCLSTPLLMLIGENDPIASPEASRRLFERLPGPHKEIVTFEGMLHELFNECDREKVFEVAADWLDRPMPEMGSIRRR